MVHWLYFVSQVVHTQQLGAYRSIERGHCTNQAMSGYKINQHQDKGLEIPGPFLHKHSWICQIFWMNSIGFVCLRPPPLAGFALMAQRWLIPMSPVDITSDVITKPLQWGRLLNHCQRTFTHFYKWSSMFLAAFDVEYTTETAFSRIAIHSRYSMLLLLHIC